jgi:hypothetical protein
VVAAAAFAHRRVTGARRAPNAREELMSHRRRMLGCVVGALMLATWAATIDAGAAS